MTDISAPFPCVAQQREKCRSIDCTEIGVKKLGSRKGDYISVA